MSWVDFLKKIINDGVDGAEGAFILDSRVRFICLVFVHMYKIALTNNYLDLGTRTMFVPKSNCFSPFALSVCNLVNM